MQLPSVNQNSTTFSIWHCADLEEGMDIHKRVIEIYFFIEYYGFQFLDGYVCKMYGYCLLNIMVVNNGYICKMCKNK